MKKGKIAVVVVTYNREKLLIESLNALTSQTQNPDSIYIIDNKSDEATPQILLDEGWIERLPNLTPEENEVQTKKIQLDDSTTKLRLNYVRKKENDGGAGGFYEGIKQAIEGGFDWIWIMDDDVVPEPNALEELMESTKIAGNFGFLCSRVVGTNGVSMNMPEIESKKGANYYPVWDELLQYGLVRVSSSTFVSVLFPSKIIQKLGYPVREMFIWGDDTEYTLRISKHYPSYMVGKSIVCHKRMISAPPSIKKEKNKNRIKMQYYAFRNQIYCHRQHKSNSDLIVYLIEMLYKFFFVLIRLKFYSAMVILKGFLTGLTFNPRIHYPGEN